jgi:hypothetical protein
LQKAIAKDVHRPIRYPDGGVLRAHTQPPGKFKKHETFSLKENLLAASRAFDEIVHPLYLLYRWGSAFKP